MKSNLKTVLLASAFFIFSTGLVRAEEVPWTDQFMQQFKEIEERIAALEKQQQEILDKQEEILKSIAQTRIWARR